MRPARNSVASGIGECSDLEALGLQLKPSRNCYPGARVDTPVPIYEYSLPELWKDWTWSEKYPGFEELRKYFAHVERKLNVKKDVAFDTRVVGAEFNQKTHKWDIKTEDGRTAHARYLINAIGFAAKRHFPDWKGLDTFKGEMHHSSFWPETGVDMEGKRVAVIGTGMFTPCRFT